MSDSLISTDEYKKLAGETNRGRRVLSEQPKDTAVVKTFAVVCKEVALEEDDNPALEFVASTGAVDRDGDTLNPTGWLVENFLKSGSFLWAHDRSLPPIGKPVAAWMENKSLRVRIKFVPAGFDHPLGKDFAQTIKRMYTEGWLRGVSVGFRPIAGEINEEREADGMFFPIDYTEQELVELSGTGVPSNPEAIYAAKEAGLNMEPLMQWASETSERNDRIWVTKETARAMLEKKDCECNSLEDISDEEEEDERPEETDTPEDITPSVVEASEEPLMDEFPEEALYADAVSVAKEAEERVVSKIFTLASLVSKQGRVLDSMNEKTLREAVNLLNGILSVPEEPKKQEKEPEKIPEEPKREPETSGLSRKEFESMIKESFAEQLSKHTGRLPK